MYSVEGNFLVTRTLEQLFYKETTFALLVSLVAIHTASSQLKVASIKPADGISARAAALPGAYVSEAYDVNSMYWNPAALVFLQKSFVAMNHSQDQEDNVLTQNLAVPLLRRKSALAIGTSLRHLGYVRDSPLGPEFRFREFGLDLGFARKIGRSLGLGTTISGRLGQTETARLEAAFSSFGLVYSPSQGISYGIAYHGLGWRIRYSFDSASTKLQRENLLGNLQIGVTMRFPRSPYKPSLVTLTASNEKNFGQDGISHRGGVELCPLRFLALRVGYQADPSMAAGRYGAGLRFDWLQIDYAISPSRASDRFQWFSVSIAFWNW